MPTLELPEELRPLRDRVVKAYDAAETLHKSYRDRWDRYWQQYHNYSDFKEAWRSASPRDRDGILRDGQREWGAELYIPYTFTVIETILPRMLSNRPRMLWLPRDALAKQNTDNMRWLLDAQQERSNYELALQTTGKTALICGLGIQKLWWRREVRERPTLVQATYGGEGRWVEGVTQEVVWNQPFAEDVDIYNFLWEPTADCIDNAGYLIHRTIRSTADVLAMFRSGEWNAIPGAESVEAADLEGAGTGRYDDLWSGRNRAQGLPTGSKADCQHEVWEFHDRRQIVTVLNRELVVRVVRNPAWHCEYPFHAFRPTEIAHRMVGKGEPEPIESLQQEMNTLRSQRRDNATLKLQQSYFFEEGTLDPMAIRFGAGLLHSVQPGSTGSLRDSLVPMQVGDIPNSGFMEEDRLRSDIERTTGVSDQAAGAAVASETATGAQLLQASANVRIQGKTRRLELEVVKPESRQWWILNQQYIREREMVRVPAAGGEWDLREVGPDQLAGVWDVLPQGGATTPDNVPQDRDDAQRYLSLLSSPFASRLDTDAILAQALSKLGMPHPESLLRPQEYVPPQTMHVLMQGLQQQLRVPEDQARAFLQQAIEQGHALAAGRVPEQAQPVAG